MFDTMSQEWSRLFAGYNAFESGLGCLQSTVPPRVVLGCLQATVPPRVVLGCLQATMPPSQKV